MNIRDSCNLILKYHLSVEPSSTADFVQTLRQDIKQISIKNLLSRPW